MKIETTRRSGRATKGQHRALDEAEPTPPPKKGVGRGRKKQDPEPKAEAKAGEENVIIRCVCGDPGDDGGMICCDQCDAWQHNVCIGLPEDAAPPQYWCELCRPQNHKELLKAIKKGERPWEERKRLLDEEEEKKLRQQEEEEKRAKKGKGKKGKRGRPSIAKNEDAETNGATTHEGDTVMTEVETPADTAAVRDETPESPYVSGNKRKLQEEPAATASSPSQSVSHHLEPHLAC